MNITDFRKEGKNLPYFLKDFHDQKDFFKAMYDMYEKELSKDLPAYNWRDNHIFCIDFFLWFCALHGYSLQKMKAKPEGVLEIHDTIKSYREKSFKDISELLNK